MSKYLQDYYLDSSDDSESNSEYLSKEKPTLKRSKRQGMCLLSDDPSQSSVSEDEHYSGVEDPNNLVSLEDDKVLEMFIMNYKSKT